MKRFDKEIILVTLIISFQTSFSLPPSNFQTFSGNTNVTINTTVFKNRAPENPVMMQYFEWNLPETVTQGNFWRQLSNEAPQLAQLGISSIWIPPPYKGHVGTSDVGYGVYDKYDLGEFNQKGTVRTKYGTKDELTRMVQNLHSARIEVYSDIVLNHLMGADEKEWVCMRQVRGDNRNEIIPGSDRCTDTWSKYLFRGRGNVYSTFTYNAAHMTGTDANGIFLFDGHRWSQNVATYENGNYDYLLGSDIDFSVSSLRNELMSWGKWFVDTTGIDGFRLDAVKHIDAYFMRDWVNEMRRHTGRNLFTVGEYWYGGVDRMREYLNQVGWSMTLFDVPLHYNMHRASIFSASYDMRRIFDGTLVKQHSDRAVTFVDNHDTQPGQGLQSFIADWFKPIAYALILLRKDGIPCIFYGDYYGGQQMNSFRKVLDTQLQIRKQYAYGVQREFPVNDKYIGWTREGDASHRGLAALISTHEFPEGYIDMNVGTLYANRNWVEATGRFPGREIYVGSNGQARFPVKGRSVAIWVPSN